MDEEILNNGKTDAILKDQNRLNHIKNAPDTQELFAMLEQKIGGNLKNAAQEASAGNAEQLINAIKSLMNDPRGAKLIQSIRDKMI